jgi:hypothetical protein
MTAILLAAALMGDVQVCASTRIESSESIKELAIHAITGAIEHRKATAAKLDTRTLESIQAALRAIGRDGWMPVLRRAAKVLGFIVADSSGTVEYSYEFDAGPKHIRRWAEIRNGSVQTSVVLTGEVGDRRAKRAELVLVANEVNATTTEIHMELRVDVAIGCIGRRIAQRKVCERLCEIEAAGRAAVKAGRSGPEAMVSRFVEGL